MIKIKINGIRGCHYTTSSIPHRSGLFPVWNKKGIFYCFVDQSKVKAIN